MTSEWQNNLPTTLRCVEKWQETPDTVSITLAPIGDEDIAFEFKPGQFVSLGFEMEGKVEYRAYSISSVPNEPLLKLTIKRVEGGLVSNHIQSEEPQC